MLGGNDPSKQIRSRKRKAFNAARDDVDKAVGGHIELQRRDDALGDLNRRLGEAKTAEGRMAHADRAIDLAKKKHELAAATHDLEAMPAAMEKLTGSELDDLRAHKEDLAKLTRHAGDLYRNAKMARDKQQESGLDAQLNDADLNAWRDRADDLVRTEDALARARDEVSAARRKLSQCLEAIGGNLVDNATLTLPSHTKLFDFLRSSSSLAAENDAMERQLARLGSGETPSHHEIDRLKDGISALRSWLRTPTPDSFVAWVRARWLRLLAVIAAVVAVGVFYWFAFFALGLAIAFGAAAGVVAAFLLADGGPSADRRSAARAAFEAERLDEPASWTVGEVEKRLRELEDKVAELADAEQVGRKRRELESELERLKKQARKLEAERREHAVTLGLDEIRSDADLVDFARALDELRQACADHAAEAGRADELKLRYSKRLGALAELVVQYGEPQPDDAAAARARLNKLDARNRQLRQALADEREAKRQLERNADNQRKARDLIAGIYANAGLEDGDEPGLAAMIGPSPTTSNVSASARSSCTTSSSAAKTSNRRARPNWPNSTGTRSNGSSPTLSGTLRMQANWRKTSRISRRR